MAGVACGLLVAWPVDTAPAGKSAAVVTARADTSACRVAESAPPAPRISEVHAVDASVDASVDGGASDADIEAATLPAQSGPFVVIAPPAHPAQTVAHSGCSRLPFFHFYRNRRNVTRDTATQVQLQINFDWHPGAGCMAGDGYGTDMILELDLLEDNGKCSVEKARARAVDWGQYPPAVAKTGRKLRFDFTPLAVGLHSNLGNPKTKEIVLRSAQHRIAVIVQRDQVLFYENTRPNSVLHRSFDAEGDQPGCCWPTTSTHFFH